MSENKTITLPSGKVAVIRPGKGRDLIAAQRVAQNPEDISFALMAVLVTIDGAQLVAEDYMEMSLQDVLTLQGEVLGNAPSPVPSTSSTSPTTPAGASAS